VALGAALSLANCLSLLYLSVRYVSGLQPGTTNPRGAGGHRHPAVGVGAWPGPFANWRLGSIAFSVAVGLAFRLRSVREGAEDHAETEPPTVRGADRPARAPGRCAGVGLVARFHGAW